MSELGLRHFTARDPDAIALIDARGRAWPRRELLALCDRLASGFVAHGLRAGDALALVAPNCAEYLAAYLAGIAAGLYVVPVNWHLADGELAYILENSGARAVIAHAALGRQRLAALAASAGTRLRVAIGGAAEFAALDDFAAAHAPAPCGRAPGRMLPYTSATTGRPKGVRRPLAGGRESLARFVAWHRALGVELEDGNVHLCSSMLYHAAPLDGAVVALEMGHTVVLLEGHEPETLLSTIAARRVTTAFMVPTAFVRLLKLPLATRLRYSTASLRFVIHGGAPCPPDVKRQMLEWWGPVIFESYGACEVQGTIASAAEWLAHPGTVGRPAPGSKLKIVGDDGGELPPGEVGAVYLAPYTGEPFEYLGDPEKTRACHRGEFVTVGDRGYVDAAGYLFLVGRDGDLIISSGMNIYPAEIEQVLIAHSAVADCAVVGAPHELCGELAEAHVELAAGFAPSQELTRALLAFLAARLSPLKLPRRIHYTAALPRDPNGKLLRRALRRGGSSHGR